MLFFIIRFVKCNIALFHLILNLNSKAISRVTAVDRNFVHDGKPYRFIGANAYELANVDSGIASAIFKDASEQGFTVLRFWCFEPTRKENLSRILDIARSLGMKVIPVLADMTGYLQAYSIDDAWFKDGYKKRYFAYACDTVSTFKHSEEILLWELINEPFSNSFRDLYNFAEHVSGKLKSISPDHLFSIGTIGGIGDRFGNSLSRFNVRNFEQLYSIETLDALSIHDYSFDSTILERLDIFYRLNGKRLVSNSVNKISDAANFLPLLIDNYSLNKFGRTFDFPLTIRSIWTKFIKHNIRIAAQLGKPIYIGEIGFKKNHGELRKRILELQLKRYLQLDVAGILLWSFESQGKSLDGHDYGFNSNDRLFEAMNFEL